MEKPAWFSLECSIASSRCAEAWSRLRRLRAGPCPPHLLTAAEARYRLAYRRRRGVLSAARRNHAHRIIAEVREGGSLWEIHRKLSAPTRPSAPKLRRQDGSLSEDPAEVASLLAQQFLSTFTSGTPPCVRSAPLPSELDATAAALPVPETALLSPEEATGLLRRLHPRKATGLDGIPSCFLKATAAPLGPGLAYLINSCITTQTVPRQWKKAWVAPIPKRSGAETAKEFRPISILSSLGKCLDKHCVSLLRSSPVQLTHPLQFGFADRSSCADSLLHLQKRVLELAADWPRGKPFQVAILSYDVAKAFDACPSSAILAALWSDGCPAWLCRLLASWLVGRRQLVRVPSADGSGHCYSAEYEATSGTPQGGCSSPLLYSVLVRPALLLPFSPGSFLQLFADDSLIVRPLRSPTDYDLLQRDSNLFASFMDSRGLSLNAAKSKLMIVSLGARPAQPPRPLMLNGAEVPVVDSLRYLGVDLDRRLSLSSHWARTASSAKRALAALGRLTHWEGMATGYLIRERVLPRLLYSLLPCPPTSRRSWQLLRSLLGYSAKRVTNRWEEHGADLLVEAGLPSASALAATAMLWLGRSCVIGGRRLGEFLVTGAHPRLLSPSRPGLRQRAPPVPQSAAPYLVQPPPPNRFASLNQLGYMKLVRCWNAFVLSLGPDAHEVISCRARFAREAEAFAGDLPPELGSDFS